MSTSSTRPGGYRNAIASDDPLVSFLYTILRDHLPAGVVEGIIAEREEKDRENGSPMTVLFSNDFLAAYALELACRLEGVSPAESLEFAQDAVVAAAEGRSDPVVSEGDPPLPKIPQLEPAAERR